MGVIFMMKSETGKEEALEEKLDKIAEGLKEKGYKDLYREVAELKSVVESYVGGKKKYEEEKRKAEEGKNNPANKFNYSDIRDYRDAVIAKTYEILEKTAKDTNGEVRTGDYDDEGESHCYQLEITTKYAEVNAKVFNIDSDKGKEYMNAHNGSNVSLDISRRSPKVLENAESLKMYREAEKALNAGLKDYKSVKVAYRG